jgi:uncharacterized protein DUF3455
MAQKENGMKNCNALSNQTTRRILPIACATALAVVFTVSLPQPAHANQVTPPPVPPNIQVQAGNKAFLEGHGVGTQNYVCAPSASSPSGVAYALFTPEATLFSDDFKQVTTHFFSPNPFEINTNSAVVAPGMIRATWQHSRDTSTVWAKVNQNPDGSIGSSSDPAFVKQGAVAWLLLKVVGAEDGPTGGDTLTNTTFIQRLNTSGGVAPPTGCALPSDVGHQAFVPYTADYFFYTTNKGDADDGN